MSRLKTGLDHKRIQRLIWLVFDISILARLIFAECIRKHKVVLQRCKLMGGLVPPTAILEEGNCSSTSTICTSKKGEKISVTASLIDYVNDPDSKVYSNSSRGTHSNCARYILGIHTSNSSFLYASISLFKPIECW